MPKCKCLKPTYKNTIKKLNCGTFKPYRYCIPGRPYIFLFVSICKKCVMMFYTLDYCIDILVQNPTKKHFFIFMKANMHCPDIY